MNPRLGLFGKLPTMGDFVAYNANLPVGQQFDRWLQAGVDMVIRKGKGLPPSPVRFLYRDPMSSGAIIGVFLPSQDRVGRQFPLAAFTYLDMPVATHRFPFLPAAYAPFLDGAANILSRASAADPNTVVHHLANLAPPNPTELEEARVWGHQALDATPGAALLEALFGPVDGGVQFHGVNMFRTACLHLRGHAPDTASTVLQCHASDDVQLVFWLRLAYDLLSWRRGPPSVFWASSDSKDTRLLLALGAPDPAVLNYLADPAMKSERLWPTVTDSPRAIEHGKQALPPPIVKALQPAEGTATQLHAVLAAPPPPPPET